MNSLIALMKRWSEAKAEERAATEKRYEIEKQICAQIEVPEEGSKTITVEDFKLEVYQGINRKVDEKGYELIKDKIPERLRPVEYVETLKLDTAGFKWLRDNEPGYYKLLASVVEEKPSKVSIKVVPR